jgi:hypothetical protein
MPLWGLNDTASNSVIWAPSQVGKAPTRAQANLLYGNTTPNAYFNGVTVGMFAVDKTEAGVTGSSVAEIIITSAGSGYNGNAVVTITSSSGVNATANAEANATGRIAAINITEVGSGYTSTPTVTVAAPSTLGFSGNSTGVVVGNSTVKGFILLGTANVALLANGDAVTYFVGDGNTAIGGLANNTTYYVTVANSTAIQLSADQEDYNGGVFINLASVGTGAQSGHRVIGQTATAVASLSGGKNKGVTPGWNIRTVGTGGRAGRVTYECLVATRNIAGDGSDDRQLPDA